MSLCFCESIPRIDNRTNILILQHVGERFHPFNTARIVQKTLSRCHLIADHNPVNWVAQRLGTAERVSFILRQQQPLSDVGLEHMRLSVTDFDDAVTQDEFCHRWNRFLRRNDVLIVYHQRTYQLLRHVEALQPRCLVLKSIFGKWRTGFHSVEELMAAEGVTPPTSEDKSRANQRLDMAVALVEHLRTRSI